MKFFCTELERKGTCYHEFQKGKWDGKTFWKTDSLLLHDDIMCEVKLHKLFREVDSEYDDYGETEIDKEKWYKIFHIANAIGGDVKIAIDEANIWAEEVFKTEEMFTILGL
ncbi:MAG: hypothetical protein II992_01905 [Lachnospiraceae bacterium]|nr:hypothetical protein [Lachnospiraceae bacterium]